MVFNLLILFHFLLVLRHNCKMAKEDSNHWAFKYKNARWAKGAENAKVYGRNGKSGKKLPFVRLNVACLILFYDKYKYVKYNHIHLIYFVLDCKWRGWFWSRRRCCICHWLSLGTGRIHGHGMYMILIVVLDNVTYTLSYKFMNSLSVVFLGSSYRLKWCPILSEVEKSSK